jgi:hypothetical protein
MRWTRYMECKGEMRNAYRIFDSNAERKRPLGTPTHGFEDNIKNYLEEVGYENMNWVVLTQDMDIVTNLQVP